MNGRINFGVYKWTCVTDRPDFKPVTNTRWIPSYFTVTSLRYPTTALTQKEGEKKTQNNTPVAPRWARSDSICELASHPCLDTRSFFQKGKQEKVVLLSKVPKSIFLVTFMEKDSAVKRELFVSTPQHTSESTCIVFKRRTTSPKKSG